MRIRVDDSALAVALKGVGGSGDDPAAGLVFAPRTALARWPDAEDELAKAFAASRESALEGGPVVFVVSAAAILGRTEPLDSAVATGLLGGARALAFERRKHNCFVSVVAVGDDVEPESVAAAVDLLVATRGANGQIFPLGTDHLGAALP